MSIKVKNENTLEKLLDAATDKKGRVRVSPALAELLLEYNTDNYRKMDPTKVKGIVRDIEAGLFVANASDNVVLMVWDKGGYLLLNGQNRLQAVANSGETTLLYVRIVDEEEGLAARDYMDLGDKRTLAQRIARGGYSNEHVCAQITRLLGVHEYYNGCKSRSTIKITPRDGWAIFMKHREGVLFATELASKKENLGVNAAYRTALARAYYSVPTERLTEFHEQFISHCCENKKTDKAAQLLVAYYINNNGLHRGGGELPTHEYYKRCEWAIHAFAMRKDVKELGEVAHAGDLLVVPEKRRKN